MTWVSFFRSDSCTFSSRVGHEPRIGTHTHTKLFTRLQRFIRQGRCIALYSATRADTINIRWVVLVTRFFPFFQWGLDVIDAGITTRLPRWRMMLLRTNSHRYTKRKVTKKSLDGARKKEKQQSWAERVGSQIHTCAGGRSGTDWKLQPHGTHYYLHWPLMIFLLFLLLNVWFRLCNFLAIPTIRTQSTWCAYEHWMVALC